MITQNFFGSSGKITLKSSLNTIKKLPPLCVREKTTSKTLGININSIIK